MRPSALVAATLWPLCVCCVRPQRIDPVTLCESVTVDSTWLPLGLGASLALSAPPDMLEAPRTDIGSNTWYTRDLIVQWEEPIPLLSKSLDPFDAYSARLNDPYRIPASPECSAPAPNGWATHTFIWKQGKALIARVFIVPPAPHERAFDLVVMARRSSAYGDALAILRSLRLSGR